MSDYQENIKVLANHNGSTYNIMKLIEELTEVEECLIKSITKPGSEKASDAALIEEFGDLKYRVDILITAKGIDKDAIKERAKQKVNKLIEFKKDKKYNNY